MGAGGTNTTIKGGSALVGQINTLIRYIKVKRASDSKWTTINQIDAELPFYDIEYPYLGTVGAGLINLTNLTYLRDYINDHFSHTSQHSDYFLTATITSPSNVPIPNFESTDAHMQQAELGLFAWSHKKGTAYSFDTPVDLSGVNAIYDENTVVAFAGNNTDNASISTAGLAIGNITSFRTISTQAGINFVSPVWRITFDRGGEQKIGAIYNIQHTSMQTNIETFSYKIGDDYFVGEDDYTPGSETTADNNTNNDNLITNFREALLRRLIKSNENNTNWYSWWEIGAIGGTTGSKYFDVTISDSTCEATNGWWTSVNFTASVTTSEYVGTILKWKSELPVDSDDASLLDSSNIRLETKDIDFGEPNVRKKVYKAYVTYKGGDGNIVCQYQANQSGTWTTATVYDGDGSDATNSGMLNTSTTQTRAELKFGTGGNNIYSFALKFQSRESISNFEINDITIIYRIKKPK